MRYNLGFRKLTFYGLIKPQSTRKSKQTILSGLQYLEFNPNFAKHRDISVVKNSVTRPVTTAVLTTDTPLKHFIQRWSHAKFQYTIYITSFNKLILFRRVILFGYNT